jgi:hypothetical protein
LYEFRHKCAAIYSVGVHPSGAKLPPSAQREARHQRGYLTMKKFKFYQFALALVAAVLISAAASELNTATAAPVASATNLQDVVPSNVEDAQWGRRRRGRRWIGPAIALGVVGAAAAAAAANQGYYGPGPGYYEEPYGYYQAPRQRCWVQTDPVYARGYWTWC